MKVLFIYRHPAMGFSIGKVFAPIEAAMHSHCEQVDALYLPASNYKLLSLWKNIRSATTKARKGGYDVVHITGSEHYLLPFLAKYKRVVTVHDIMYYSTLSGIKKWLWKWFFIAPLKRAERVTFISDYTRRQVEAVVTLNKAATSVVLNPVSPDFRYSPKVFNSDTPVVLHIGTLPRKNLVRTIQALTGLTCHLHIVGRLQPEVFCLLEESRLSYTLGRNLTDREIVEAYEGCDVVNFPSTHEGFGMPVIEGQAVGRVVLTSDISPMKDICGEGAYLVDPYRVSSIREGYIELFKNSARRKSLVENGIHNARLYDLLHITARYYVVYKSMFGV